MKRFLALAALVLGMVSCQTEPEGLDVNVGGEQDVNITVSLPEGTRANSALGAFDNVNFEEYDVRFQCEVHYGNQVKKLETQYSDNGTEATFNVRLIANRNYTFVVWADLVEEDSTADLHYNTANGLTNITLNNDTWVAMDETRDAFTCSEVREFTRNANINLELKRPFAKLRVITTDMEELAWTGVKPTSVKVQYTTPYYAGFNALAQTPTEQSSTGKVHDEVAIVSYDETGANKTLFTDYFFAQEGDIVNFQMIVNDQNGDIIDEQKNFNTPIPVKRNYVTTIKGNILTYADDFTVTIKDAFDNADDLDEVPYYQEVISSVAELFSAFENGGEYILNEDLSIDSVPATISRLAATRTAVETVVDLNGHTITVTNKTQDAFYTVAEDESIRFEGEGSIVLTEDNGIPFILNEGTVAVAGAYVETGAIEGDIVDYVALLRQAFEEGRDYQLVYNLVVAEGLKLANGKSMVLDLNGKTITGYDNATASFGLITNNGNLTVKNGTITLKAENNRAWNAYSSVISNSVGGNLVVENVTLEHLGGTDMAYGIDNLTNGKGTSAITNINEGAVVKSTYRAVRQFLNGIEATNELYVNAGAVVEGANKSIWMQDPSAKANTGKLVVAEGATLNGDVYLFVTAGSTEWPVEVSIAASAVNGEVLTGNVPAQYAVVEKDGVWTIEMAYEIDANGAYIIKNEAGMMWLVNEVDGGNTFEGQIVKLGADIDLYAEDENGEPICVDPIGSYRFEKAFMGTLDGQGHTISGLNQNTWALDNGYYYSDCGLGLFGALVNAKIQNLTIDDAHISGESALCGIITAYAENTTFENITVKNSDCADYQYYAGGIVAWVSGENNNFIKCNIDASTTVASQWGDFDNSIGGVIGGVGGSAKVFMKDCTVACRIDAVNDVVSAYQWYAYRRSGMLIGNTSKTETIDGKTVAIAPQLTCENVKVIYDDWANYTYCEFAGTNYPYVRVQEGISVGAYVNVRYGHPTDAAGNVVVDDNHVHNEGEDHHLLLPFDQLYGGGQGVYGNPVHEGVTVVYNNL